MNEEENIEYYNPNWVEVRECIYKTIDKIYNKFGKIIKQIENVKQAEDNEVKITVPSLDEFESLTLETTEEK